MIFGAIDTSKLMAEATAISVTGSSKIHTFAVDIASVVTAMNLVMQQQASQIATLQALGGGSRPGWFDPHGPPFNWPLVDDDITTQVQASLANAPYGAVIALRPHRYIFNLDHSTRPDLSFIGIPAGQIGNKNAQDPDVGTWVQGAAAGKPVFTCIPAWQANVAPTYAHLLGNMNGDRNAVMLRVGNCNNGRIWSCGSKYGRAVVFADGGSDCAYWDVRDIRSYDNSYGMLLSNNFGWNVSGANLFMESDSQVGVYLTRAAQNNRFTLVMTDGFWNDSTQHVGGISVAADGQAHHNYFTLFKFESTNPAVHLMSPDASTQSPTRAISLDHGVFGGRYGTSIAVQIDQWVDQTFLGDDLAFVSGSNAPVINNGTGTHLPAKLRLSLPMRALVAMRLSQAHRQPKLRGV